MATLHGCERHANESGACDGVYTVHEVNSVREKGIKAVLVMISIVNGNVYALGVHRGASAA